jgi:FkbM family methyltransferase
MIRRFDVRSIGVDPTRKHHPGLYHLASELAGRFRLLPYALGITNGGATFYESGENESGSLYSDHRNIENDSIVAYDVEVINLAQLVREAGPGHVELLKLDVEGGEFGILSDAGPELANTFPQIIVEFHHDVVGRWKFADSQRLVRRLGTLGYQWHSRDAINYLFFRP